MLDPARLLGFAFTNADFLFEVDRDGRIAFAAGAANEFVHDSKGAIAGDCVSRLFSPVDSVKFTTMVRALGAGGRAGPVTLKLAHGAPAQLSLFRLPENGGLVSCTLTKPGERSMAPGGIDKATRLADRHGFLAAAANASGDDELALVNVPALGDLSTKLAPEEAQKLLNRLGETILEAGTKAAGRISVSSFGAISSAAGGLKKLGQSIRKALQEGGIEAGAIEETLVSLKTDKLTADQRMLALRYVVDRFAVQAKDPNAPRDLSGAFDKLMSVTQDRALALTQTVADGSFSLAFQPIVDLKTGAISHYEALARFSENADTGEIIGFAEALGIADAFDLAVAIKVISHVGRRESGSASVAFNVSGRTLSSPAAFGMLAAFLARKRSLAPRILIEVTETAEIADVANADRAIQSVREMGFRVGLDDFGAGAASLQYLHGFTVDFVKMDGALVKKLGASRRDDTLVRGIVKLCAELGLTTIAECIEDDTLMQRARDIGFELGQGVHCGKPDKALLPGPVSTDAAASSQSQATTRAKRKGVRESWG